MILNQPRNPSIWTINLNTKQRSEQENEKITYFHLTSKESTFAAYVHMLPNVDCINSVQDYAYDHMQWTAIYKVIPTPL